MPLSVNLATLIDGCERCLYQKHDESKIKTVKIKACAVLHTSEIEENLKILPTWYLQIRTVGQTASKSVLRALMPDSHAYIYNIPLLPERCWIEEDKREYKD